MKDFINWFTERLQPKTKPEPQPQLDKTLADTKKVDVLGREGGAEEAQVPPWEMDADVSRESGGKKTTDVPVSVGRLPNIGPEGRFLVYHLEQGLLHHKIDFSEAYSPELFTTLKEVNPFNVRAWMGEYHYDDGVEVKASSCKEGFYVPQEVKLHGIKYKYDRVVGKGAMGAVIKYVSEEGDEIAMKVIVLDKNSADVENTTVRELRALEEITYQAVLNPGDRVSPLTKAVRRTDGAELLYKDCMVRFVDATYLCPREGQRAVAIFSEFLSGGDLRDVLDANRQVFRDPDTEKKAEVIMESVKYGIDMAKALIDVHSCGITHRDVKPGNFMCDSDSRVKLTDFGISRGDFARAQRAISKELVGIDANLKNDLEGLYILAATAGKGFGKPKNTHDLLSSEEQAEIWDWLQKWEKYEHDPELSNEQRAKLLKELIFGGKVKKTDGTVKLMPCLNGEDGLIKRHEDKIYAFAQVEPSLKRWVPSKWSHHDEEKIDDVFDSVIEQTTLSPEDSLRIYNDRIQRLASSSNVTKLGVVAGTPKYFSPEVAQGMYGIGHDGKDRGYHEDVFSLGVILAELTRLGGVKICEGENDRDRLKAMIHARAKHPDAGIELNFAHELLPKDVIREVQRSVRARLRGGASEDEVASVSLNTIIELLSKESGVARLLGLIASCVQKDYRKRPTMEEVLKTLNKIRLDLTSEDAKEAASAA